MADVLGTVQQVSGTAYVRGEDGQLQEIRPGDQVLEGQTIVTPEGSAVELLLADGTTLSISAQPSY